MVTDVPPRDEPLLGVTDTTVGGGGGVGEGVGMGDGGGGLNCTSITGWSSIPFGATPVCPCRKSKKPIPRTRTGVFVVLKLVVALNFASNSFRALWIDERKQLPAEQAGSGISVIIV